METLQPLLSASVGLYLAAKQAHWVVLGPHFQSLHALFGELADAAEDAADTLAERIAQMHGTPVQSYADFQIRQRDGLGLVRELLVFVQRVSAGNLAAIKALGSDQVTANIVINIEEALEKLRWKLDNHLR